MYQKIEEPVLPKFGYTLPDEWYIPSDAMPTFEMSIYAGT
jgi:hypothetical protein